MAGLLDRHAAQLRNEDPDSTSWNRGQTRSESSEVEGGNSDSFVTQLVRTIEGEVIPRLMLTHRAAVEELSLSADGDCAPDVENVEEFAQLIVSHDDAIAFSYVEAMRAQGVSIEKLLLDLLAPTARHLGDLWVADLCTFADVTIGLGRLQQILRSLGHEFSIETDPKKPGRRALLAAVPGDQHTFGIFIVSEFLRRAGWDVAGGPISTNRELIATVRQEWFAVVGLSLSTETKIENLKSAIKAIRDTSRNGGVGVLVGGPFFIENPEIVEKIGADAMAPDAKEAVKKAEKLLAQCHSGRL